jgi:hypothetical protein
LIALITLFYPAEQGYSIFVKSLPFNSTVEMVEEEFQKFGAIKPGGIQVRNNKVCSSSWFWIQSSSCAVCLTFVLLLLQIDQYCFGFVEFESQQSMQAAIQVCFIMDKLSFYNIYGDDVTDISCYDVGFSAIY